MMTLRKGLLGPLLLCLLGLGALAAQSAGAAGTTGFTCVKTTEGGAGFSREHCRTEDVVASGAKFKHVAVPVGTTTEARITNEHTGSETTATTPVLLKTSIAGVLVTLEAKKVEDLATGKDVEVGGEHLIEGTGVTTYKEVTVTQPAGKGCKVPGGTITTNKLRGTSTGMEGKLEPASGTVFAVITIEGCTITALNNSYQITGSIKCPGDGAEVRCTHTATTTQGTLRMAGQNAGVEVATTFSGRASPATGYTPLGVTTVP
jgi:hypothetical protein